MSQIQCLCINGDFSVLETATFVYSEVVCDFLLRFSFQRRPVVGVWSKGGEDPSLARKNLGLTSVSVPVL